MRRLFLQTYISRSFDVPVYHRSAAFSTGYLPQTRFLGPPVRDYAFRGQLRDVNFGGGYLAAGKLAGNSLRAASGPDSPDRDSITAGPVSSPGAGSSAGRLIYSGLVRAVWKGRPWESWLQAVESFRLGSAAAVIDHYRRTATRHLSIERCRAFPLPFPASPCQSFCKSFRTDSGR
jgi:hypothetical protein